MEPAAIPSSDHNRVIWLRALPSNPYWVDASYVAGSKKKIPYSRYLGYRYSSSGEAYHLPVLRYRKYPRHGIYCVWTANQNEQRISGNYR
jgi:hypothetical protein